MNDNQLPINVCHMNKYWLLLTHVDGNNIMLAWMAIIISSIVAVDHCCTNHCESQVAITRLEDSGDKKIEMLTKCQIRSPAHRLRISFAHNETCQVDVTKFYHNLWCPAWCSKGGWQCTCLHLCFRSGH